MSQLITIPNYESANIRERSSLAVATNVGDTSITLFNNNNITTNDIVIFGRLGSETAEMRTISSASGATIVTTAALSFPHEYNADATALMANKIKIYRASNVDGSQPSDASFSLIATVDIDVDQPDTNYTDSSGSEDYWYKYTYYNSISSAATNLADSTAARGGNSGNYTTVEDVRKEAGFERNFNITSADVYQCIIDAQSYINGSLEGRFTIPFTTPINPFVSKLTKVLAAGYLQIIQYDGAYGLSNNSSSDNEKVTWVMDQLGLINDGSLKLVNPDGSTLGQPNGGSDSAQGFSGYPNSSAPSDEPRMFEVQDIVGYNERQY